MGRFVFGSWFHKNQKSIGSKSPFRNLNFASHHDITIGLCTHAHACAHVYVYICMYLWNDPHPLFLEYLLNPLLNLMYLDMLKCKNILQI